jgi:histone deacetylase 6
MGDAEYLAAFRRVVMPVAQAFAPDIVLVSAGFDSARGDPLGGMDVTPVGFAHMTAQLSTLARGRVVLALEGGYNLRSVARGAEACVRALLGEPLDPLAPGPGNIKRSARACLERVERVLKPHWPCLRTGAASEPAEEGSRGKSAPSFAPRADPSGGASDSETGSALEGEDGVFGLEDLVMDCQAQIFEEDAAGEEMLDGTLGEAPLPAPAPPRGPGRWRGRKARRAWQLRFRPYLVGGFGGSRGTLR